MLTWLKKWFRRLNQRMKGLPTDDEFVEMFNQMMETLVIVSARQYQKMIENLKNHPIDTKKLAAGHATATPAEIDEFIKAIEKNHENWREFEAWEKDIE